MASRYASTIRNLKVDGSTKCIVQGFTGKSVSEAFRCTHHLPAWPLTSVRAAKTLQSTFHSKLSMEMGTNIVGGVSPGKGGQVHLERPVFDSVKEVRFDQKLHCEATF